LQETPAGEIVKGQLKINFDIKDEYSDVIYTIDTIDASSAQ
jgi:hypothetical protein